jgi:hypothetical protein
LVTWNCCSGPLAKKLSDLKTLEADIAVVPEQEHCGGRVNGRRADPRYQNARKNSDRQNAKIEHDEALKRVMNAVLKDDTELFKQFMDNEGFRRWLTNTVFGMTYDATATGG